MKFFKFKLKETKKYADHYYKHSGKRNYKFSEKVYEFKSKELRELNFCFKIVRDSHYNIVIFYLCYYKSATTIIAFEELNIDNFNGDIIDIEILIYMQSYLGVNECSKEVYKNRQRLFDKYFRKYLMFI